MSVMRSYNRSPTPPSMRIIYGVLITALHNLGIGWPDGDIVFLEMHVQPVIVKYVRCLGTGRVNRLDVPFKIFNNMCISYSLPTIFCVFLFFMACCHWQPKKIDVTSQLYFYCRVVQIFAQPQYAFKVCLNLFSVKTKRMKHYLSYHRHSGPVEGVVSTVVSWVGYFQQNWVDLLCDVWWKKDE